MDSTIIIGAGSMKKSRTIATSKVMSFQENDKMKAG